MSQVFGADGVSSPASLDIPTTVETPVLMNNFLNPPFGNAKVLVTGSVVIVPGAGTTSVALRLRRNPSAENLQIAGLGTITVTPGTFMQIYIAGADVIPDGRAVRYQLTVQQTGATADGTTFSSSVFALLISG